MSNPDKVRPDLLEDGDFPVSFGRYELLGLLGDGGMARVFRAELKGPRGFRKKAAVKVIRAALGGQNEQLTRALIHEARLGGLLHHPNVVETYDFGELDGQAWIAMELVTGIGLDRLLSIREPVPPPVALEITAQIIDRSKFSISAPLMLMFEADMSRRQRPHGSLGLIRMIGQLVLADMYPGL